MMPEHGLSKFTWTTDDFAAMGWHDARIWAYTFHKSQAVDVTREVPTPQDRLLLDLDYITRWVHPDEPGEPFSFWVAPATLVFTGVLHHQNVH
jgi:hypothetical protein